MGKWEIVRLGDVCDVLNGYAFQSQNYIANGHRVIRITNVQKGIIVDDDPKYYEQASALNKYELRDGDLLLSLTGNVGRVGIITASLLPAYLNQRVACLRVKDTLISKRFLFSYFNSDHFERDAVSSSKGLAQKNMSTEWLKEYPIPLLPLPVQQQIADVLDRASALIEKRKAQIKKLDLLIKSQFIDMFGNPVSNPNGWSKKRVKECLKGIENGVSPKCEAFPALFGQYGVLKLSAVTYGHYIEQENKQLFPDTKVDTKIEVCNEDLLMTRKNTYDLVGMCAYVFSTRPGLMLPDLIFRLIPKNEVHSIYLWQLINCDFFRPEIKKLASGTSGSMPNISKERLNSLEIPIPPIEIQREFASFVHQVEAQKSLLQQSLAKLEQNYKSLMQKCFRREIF